MLINGHLPSTSGCRPCLPPPSTPVTPTMDALNYREPPTESSVAEARRALQAQRQELSQLSERITSAEDALAQIVTDRKRAIQEMQCEQHALEEKVKLTLAYISPIRRLPHELLRHIFMFNFDNHPCCAWILASVCVLWRRLALSIPKLWSKVSGESSMKHFGSGCTSYSHIHIGAQICVFSPHLSPTDISLEFFAVNTPLKIYRVPFPFDVCRAHMLHMLSAFARMSI